VRVNTVNPLSDSRWDDLVARHPQASAFHTRGWLDALARTYGYEPLVLTSSRSGEPLSNGLVLCRVESRFTGCRLVSLPFADHCEPLLARADDRKDFEVWLRHMCDHEGWRYVELRPLLSEGTADHGWHSGRRYCFHSLDLTPTLEQLFQNFHRDSLQRRIRHAEREHLSYEVGRDERLVKEFYSLVCRTRRRHGIFPQPMAWFRNLVHCMGESLQLRIARKDGTPVAGMLTFRHRSRVIYKYGCSDERFHKLAAVPFLFWRVIEESKATGATELDFGRSDTDQASLITFKDRFGSKKRNLIYVRYSPCSQEADEQPSTASWAVRAGSHLVRCLPNSILKSMGRILYRHIG
jgi:Acetyltransferase (GNAT) domain